MNSNIVLIATSNLQAIRKRGGNFMHYLRCRTNIFFLWALLILSLCACSVQSMMQSGPLGTRLAQEPASFTIQDGPFTYEKNVIINPEKIDELTRILRKAKWQPAQAETEGSEIFRLQLDDDDSLLLFSVREDGSALCVNSLGDRYTIDAKSYDKLHALMIWAKGEVVEEGAQLGQIWDEYLHDTYYTLGNGGSWSSPEDLPA
jgi:hypothetical protein